jgi:hypothetical protein
MYMNSKDNFNLYIWKSNQADFNKVKQKTKLINKLLDLYFEKQRQPKEQKPPEDVV